MIIEAIVDLPSGQVNHVFDYKVPQEWEDFIQIGLRVEVPFGRRRLLAFVTAIKEDSEYDGKLKEIAGLLDYQSFLSPELIELSQVLAEDLQSFRISILQAMLPSMLKVKYQAVFRILDKEVMAPLVGHTVDQLSEIIDRTVIEEVIDGKRLKDLIDRGVIVPDYQVLDQKTTKKIKMLTCLLNKDQLLNEMENLGKGKMKQGQLLHYLYQQEMDTFEKSALIEAAGVSVAVVKRAIEKGWLMEASKEVFRQPYEFKSFEKSQPKTLLAGQQKAFDAIHAGMTQVISQTYLLEGVTGSGKTEVYLQLMAQALDQGKGAILLVPEIALTPQMVDRVISRFGSVVAVLHSGLSIAEKYDEWQRIIQGKASIVVGARSSIFAPLKNIGIIIIDEEHETTYKQGDNPRYHARNVAIWRSNYHACPLVLGSATPCLESRARAQVGKYQLVMMEDRVNQSPLPPVELIDMTQYLGQDQWILSPELEEKMQEVLDRKEKIVLLLNRRGYANYVQCRSCGYVVQCPHCDISLTYHKVDHCLKCHYCDYQQPLPNTCPDCGFDQMRTRGIGTQQVVEILEEKFPGVLVVRMDNDTTRTKGAHQQLLESFNQEGPAILLGTQMIAKGLDFEQVTLVGVINADTGINMPDFRSGEKTFQLLTQVAGRTGRGKLAGQVLIQTYNPDHYVMQFAKNHDYEGFFYYEMQRRHLGAYPPYFYTTLLTVSSKDRGQGQLLIYQAKEALVKLQDQLKSSGLEDSFHVLGPNTGGIARINDIYYFQLLLKYKKPELIRPLLGELMAQAQELASKKLYLTIDHEPQYFM